MDSDAKGGFAVTKVLKRLKTSSSKAAQGNSATQPLFPEAPTRAARSLPVARSAAPSPPVARSSDPSAAFAAAFKLVTEAKRDTQVLVMSLPRTGSKYLQGVLAAAYGIARERTPVLLTGRVASFFGNAYMINPGHCHGVNETRLESLLLNGLTDANAVEDVWRKAHVLMRLRTSLRRARRQVVFTITRPQRERIISAFALQKAGRIDFNDPDLLWENWQRFEEREIADEQIWWDENISGELGVPAAVIARARAGIEPYVAHMEPKLVHVFVSLKQLDAMLEERLFPVVSADVLRARTAELGLRFGLGSTNSSESRGLSEAKAKLVALIAERE